VARVRVEPAEVAETLGLLERRLRGTAPAEVVARLRSIRAALGALLPRVRGTVAPQLLLAVATAAFLDAPQAVDAYLALAPAVRLAASPTDEPNAARVLAERLERLDIRLAALLGTAYAPDLGRLAANGRFLRERFARD
jgi:hypothetical protein